MNTQITAMLMSVVLYTPLVMAAERVAPITTDRISVFKVPLVCPAAPLIGCGTAAKPILLDLEKQPGVLEAWLNRAGTMIAVVWKPDSTAENRRSVGADLKEDNAVEMQGTSREDAVRELLSGQGWYHGADVDRLSEEEAGIIAARWVRRVQTKTTLAKDTAEALQRAIAESLRKELTGQIQPHDRNPARLEDVGRAYLAQDQVKFLTDAIDKGARALPNEN